MKTNHRQSISGSMAALVFALAVFAGVAPAFGQDSSQPGNASAELYSALSRSSAGTWLYAVTIPDPSGDIVFQGTETYTIDGTYIHAGLSNDDEAFNMLDRAFEGHSYLLAEYPNTDERLERLRSDPPSDALRRKIGLPKLR